MPAKSQGYYSSLISDQKMLRSHGFGDSWPDAEGILRYACGVEDGLHALAGALGLKLEQDHRGNWRIADFREERGKYA